MRLLRNSNKWRAAVIVLSSISFVIGLFSLTSTFVIAGDGAYTTSPIFSLFTKNTCTSDIVEKAKRLEHPWQFNELRRVIAIKNPNCFENELFPIFARAFQSRIGIKQFNLHIPKTGGTSLCDLAHENGLKRTGLNCHPDELGPYWCCREKETLEAMSCEKLRATQSDFVGNERWLDHDDDSFFCHDMAYSVTIREPIARAMSQMNHFLRKFVMLPKKNPDAEIRAKRIGIIQSNYMTWSLVSGSSEDPTMFLVKQKHLEMAKQILSRFDYVLDIGGSTPPNCLATILEYMGMKNSTLSHSQKSPFQDYTSSYHKEHYEMLNAIDTELYQYAQEMIRVDCDFFQRVKDMKNENA